MGPLFSSLQGSKYPEECPSQNRKTDKLQRIEDHDVRGEGGWIVNSSGCFGMVILSFEIESHFVEPRLAWNSSGEPPCLAVLGIFIVRIYFCFS